MKFLAVIFSVTLLASCGSRSSDEERVRALLERAEEAVEARDTSDVLELVADDYADSQGLDKMQLQNFLRGYFLTHPKIELIVDIDALEFPADGLAQADVTITSLATGGPDRQKLRVEFRRAAGEWRVARADRARRRD
jgi:ketosteroid isomerase-like protein